MWNNATGEIKTRKNKKNTSTKTGTPKQADRFKNC
jgi:hypothetical protein